MKIVVVVMNDILFQPIMYSRLIPEIKRNYEIKGGFLLPSKPPTITNLKNYNNMFGLFGIKGFSYLFIRKLKHILNHFSGSFPYLKDIFLKNKINCFYIERLSDIGLRNFIINNNVDLIISSCSHIYKKELLKLPKIGVLNIHAGKLPLYRGVFPTFWAMNNGDKTFTLTTHLMDEKIDKGLIVREREIQFKSTSFTDSVEQIVTESPSLIIDSLRKLKGIKDINHLTKVKGKGKYYSFPSSKHRKAFIKKGFTIV